MRRRPSLIHILFLGFYLFYSLSPLLYQTEGAQGDCQSDVHSCFTEAFASDLQLSFEVPSNQDGAQDPAACVLLKKKRAIPPSSKDVVEKLSQCAAQWIDFKPAADAVVIAAPIPPDSPLCPDGFQFYHSGISPPLA